VSFDAVLVYDLAKLKLAWPKNKHRNVVLWFIDYVNALTETQHAYKKFVDALLSCIGSSKMDKEVEKLYIMRDLVNNTYER